MNLKMLCGHHLAIIEATSIPQFRSEVIRFARSKGFETVSAMAVVDHSITHTSFYCIDNIPEIYRTLWEDPTLMRLDPVMQHGKRSSIPIIWDRETYVSAGQGQLWEQQAEYGFKTGIGVALHLPGDEHFFIGVDRDKPLAWHSAKLTSIVADIQLFAVHASEAARKLLLPEEDGRSSSRPSLTPRELEALRWTMDGKIAWEVAEELNISERTAVFHLQNATKKLGCKSKFQAVLKAIQFGLLY